MSTNNETTGPVAALMIPKQNIALIMFARAVYNALLKNPSVADPL